MRAPQIGITILLSFPLLTGCEYNPEPLGVYEVFVDAYSFRSSFRHDGGDYNAKFGMCIRDLASGLECGERLDPTDEYDYDSFVFETKGEEAAITTCYDKYDKHELANEQIRNADCMVPFKSLSAGQEIRVTVNQEFSETLITIPTVPKVTAPLDDEKVSLNADGGLRVTWEANGAKGDTIGWHVRLLYGEPEACGDSYAWFWVEGVVDDTGATTIPMELVPQEIPAEGCAFSLWIDRRRPGKTDPGIKHEYVLGHQVYSVPFRLMP